MSLILPQKVKLKWREDIKQYYMEKGYNFTSYKDFFECNILDVKEGSSVEVMVLCDSCVKILTMPYKRYNKLHSEKYCCPECLSHKRKYIDENGSLQFIDVPYRNREWLFEEYITKNRSAPDIANECGINQRTLREWVSILELPDKPSKTIGITEEALYDLYVIKHISTVKIGEIYNVDGNTISSLMRKFGIKIRTVQENTNIFLYEHNGIEKLRERETSMENRVKKSCWNRGIDIKDFDGFLSKETKIIRCSYEYKNWRKKVFERDNYTCQCCGRRGGDLQAHHLLDFHNYIEERFDIKNGITLCIGCHSPSKKGSFHSIYGSKGTTPEQLYEYILNHSQRKRD